MLAANDEVVTLVSNDKFMVKPVELLALNTADDVVLPPGEVVVAPEISITCCAVRCGPKETSGKVSAVEKGGAVKF